MSRFVPAEPIPPGEILQDELDARNWTHHDLAAVLGMTARQVLNLVGGKSAITPESASKIAEAFGQDAKDWMNFQVAYELAALAQKDRKVKKRAAIYSKVPVREMIRRGWLEDEKDADALGAAVCRFLRIKTIDDQPTIKWAARKSGPYSQETAPQVPWYFRARQLAECLTVPKQYRDSAFDSTLAALRTLAAHRADARRVPKVLADSGIRFLVIEHLKRSKLDGACLWLDNHSPAIAISLRLDRIDNFWFTLMHEMAHVKFHDESVDDDIFGPSDDLPEHERRANEHAAEFLIARTKLDSFIARKGPLFYKARIIEFANAQRIHPGIVLGQLQFRGQVKYGRLRNLLEKVRGEIVGHALTDGWGDCPVIGELP